MGQAGVLSQGPALLPPTLVRRRQERKWRKDCHDQQSRKDLWEGDRWRWHQKNWAFSLSSGSIPLTKTKRNETKQHLVKKKKNQKDGSVACSRTPTLLVSHEVASLLCPRRQKRTCSTFSPLLLFGVPVAQVVRGARDKESLPGI